MNTLFSPILIRVDLNYDELESVVHIVSAQVNDIENRLERCRRKAGKSELEKQFEDKKNLLIKLMTQTPKSMIDDMPASARVIYHEHMISVLKSNMVKEVMDK